MSNSKQVQLRGGTSQEHENFVGAPREITVDTTKNTIRVHDGSTVGGHSLAKSEELENEISKVTEQLADLEHNIEKSHNHDGLYSKLEHNHDGRYVKEVEGRTPAYTIFTNSFHGFCAEGDDSNWIRTTRNGLIPYQSGGYSNIGTSSWRFAEGWFNRINTKSITVDKEGNTSSIDFPATVNDPGFIRHIENNNTAGMYFSASDDIADNDRFYFGGAPGGNFQATAHLTTAGDLWLERGLSQRNWTISVGGGAQIYFNGERPWDAPEGSISFG